MKAALLTGIGKFETRKVPEPEITKPNDVLIRIHTSAICGTDMHIWNWDAWSQKTIPVPMHVGHEYAGVIEQVGAEVSGYGWIRADRLQYLCHRSVGLGVDLDLLEELGLSASSIAVGLELDEDALALLALAAEAREAEKRGLALIARAEQSVFMLRMKLESRDFSKKAVGLALDRLTAENLVDDRRFAAAISRAPQEWKICSSAAVATRSSVACWMPRAITDAPFGSPCMGKTSR